MPVYQYRCPECMMVWTLPRTIALRDAPTQCARCLFHDRTSCCERIPDAPTFVVKGFNAKNGYSRG